MICLLRIFLPIVFLIYPLITFAVPLQIIAVDPVLGPICQGPLGPGQCAAVQNYIQMQQQPVQFQLQVIGSQPGIGPICAGPLGPGPCAAIQQYLKMQQLNTAPASLPQTFNVINNVPNVGPICNSLNGPMPCNLVQQQALDQFHGVIPAPISTVNKSPQDLAIECARNYGLNTSAFIGCVGHQVILPKKQQQVLDCAVSNKTAEEFANCAAPELGISLSHDQEIAVNCAQRSGGDTVDFVTCAGDSWIAKNVKLPARERKLMACARDSEGSDDFLTCASNELGDGLSSEQRAIIKCAQESNGSKSNFLSCAGEGWIGKNLSNDQKAAIRCARDSSDTSDFATCSADYLLGENASKEQKVALRCAAEYGGDATQMASCAGANMFNLQLNPEQQIAVQCVVQTGGQPYAAAGCMATRLTARELVKCATDGFGGDDCFGDSNDLVGKNGWVARNMGQIAGGPNSVINNPDQIWGGSNSFLRNPNQIFGGSNSFIRNPVQIWGGSNSVFNNPGQLVPKPVQVGTVGDTRICIPWC